MNPFQANETPWALYARKGSGRYDGEEVSQLQHALQAAALARAGGHPESLQLAALFHDVGHLLVEAAGEASARGVDLRHEQTGARFLARWFKDAVCGPVRLHVEAKRYLARDPAYVATLSPESVRSLAVQGGPMTEDEAEAFLTLPHAQGALRLRHFDDLAKDPKAVVPDLDAWVAIAERASG